MIFNMLMQIIVGIPLELSHGTIRVALLYLSGVFAASLTFSLAEPGLNLAGNYQGYSYTYMIRYGTGKIYFEIWTEFSLEPL